MGFRRLRSGAGLTTWDRSTARWRIEASCSFPRAASTPDVEGFIEAVIERWGVPGGIVADRYKEAELYDALNAARVPARSRHVARNGVEVTVRRTSEDSGRLSSRGR